jgi:hypothetical protein
MNSDPFNSEHRFRELWDAVQIVRPVPYTLFTFGASDLLYYLVVAADPSQELVQVSQGKVTVTRPMIITPYDAPPELKNFFEDGEYEGLFDFMLTRTAAFSNLRLDHQKQRSDFTSDSVEEVVARLNRQLDAEEEDRMAILTAPAGLGSVAVFKYATERILESAPGNIQELRERGLLD